MDVTIRQATISDLGIIQELNYKLFLWDYDRDPTMNIEWPHQPAGEAYFTKRINDERGICLVAEFEGRIVGYVAGRVDAAIDSTDTVLRSELENIYIEESARSKGVGKLLVQELIKLCKEKNAQSMFVTAYYDNEDAIGFYKACGFGPFALKLERGL